MQYHPTADISDNHWAVKCDPIFFVAYLGIQGFKVLVKVNPTDRRCYRLILQLYTSEKIQSTFNRQWTTDEMNAVFKAGSIISQYYFWKGLFPQIYFAGNNSMEKFEDKLLVGKKEPSMMHLHVLGRGITEKEYIKGIPLGGPAIGEEFNLKGQGSDDLGLKKVGWSIEQEQAFVEDLRAWLNDQPYTVSYE